MKKDESSEEDKLNLLERIEELQRKLEQKDTTICHLEKTLEEKNIEMEATLHGKIMELEYQRRIERLAGWNKELKLHLKISELRKKVEKSDLNMKNYEMKQRERDAESENMEAVLNGRIKELEKQLEGYRVTREQEKKEERCAGNGQMLDTLNPVINRVQKERQEAASESQDTLGHLYIMGACERENVEAPIVPEAPLHQDMPLVPQGLVDSKKTKQLVEEKHEESVEETMQELVEDVTKKEDLFQLTDEEESEENPPHFTLWQKMKIVTGGVLVGLVAFALAMIGI